MDKITYSKLSKILPAAVTPAVLKKSGVDRDDLKTAWIMKEKPVCITPYNEDSDEAEEWTETNEPELAECLSESWDDLAVDGVVYFCGSYDDEYGFYWSNKDQEWFSYSY